MYSLTEAWDNNFFVLPERKDTIYSIDFFKIESIIFELMNLETKRSVLPEKEKHYIKFDKFK